MRSAESLHGAGCGELLLRPPFPVLLDAIGAEPAVGILGDQDAVDHDRCGTQGVPGDAGARSQFARVQLEPVQVTVEVRSEEHTSELQSLMRISYAVFCLKKKKHNTHTYSNENTITTQY